ncbi:putative acyl carrier protein [Aeromicrobium marinum DSM 15272]|uniref:Acyl carrier protein n=2 Tax=Aeromicrobium marinum TaxID=219314 RepID=E2SAX3_9ACTN|nr:putative acyl carrier protein [Aeromicrobium marinum DSM 15272]
MLQRGENLGFLDVDKLTPMATSTAVHEALTDILVRLVDCEADEVAPSTPLRDLGVDSLMTVEMADEIGRRFDVYVADEVVDGYRTVADVVRSVAHHPSTAARVPATAVVASSSEPLPDPRPSGSRLAGAAAVMVVVGVVIGGLIGIGGSALVDAAGLDEAALPPLPSATPAPTPTSEAPPPEEEPAPVDPDVPQPTLQQPAPRAAPGERIELAGTFPGLGEGAVLQVQAKEPTTEWSDFPVTATTAADETFRTLVFTTRTGERRFRLVHVPTGGTTPEVVVTIG